MWAFGLTGGVASGKSTVARLLREVHQIPVIDADLVSRELVEPGKPALTRIVEAFGPEVLAADGTLDRAKLRELIVHDEAARHRLNAILHPAIREAIVGKLAALAVAGVRIAGVEAALLIESGQYKAYPALVVVTASPEVQRARLLARDGVSPRSADAMLQAQLPNAAKAPLATFLVTNDGDLPALTASVERLAADLRARAQSDEAS